MSLTTKQRAYFEARVQGLSPFPAARAAGFANPDVRCVELERHPKVKQLLEFTARKALSRAVLGREDVLSGLLDAVHMSQNSTELTGAWREIGKIIGAYEPEKKPPSSEKEITAERLAQLDDDELLALSGHDDFRLPPPKEPEVVDGDFEEVLDDRPAA